MNSAAFMTGAIRAARLYFRALFGPATVLLILVIAAGTPWIEEVVEAVESWDPEEWVRALYLALLFALLVTVGRRTLWLIREDQRSYAQGVAHLPRPGDEIPAAMHTAWLKIARGPGGPGYADWVIAKSNPGDSHKNLIESAERWRSDWDPPTANRDESVARHEAGHAIAAQALGFTVLKMTVVPWLQLAGHVAHACPIPKIADHEVAWRRTIIALAGQAVDLAGGVHDGGSTSDMEQAVTNARLVASTGLRPSGYDGELNTDAILAAARDNAQAIVRDNSQLVEEMAVRLLDQRTMGNHAVRDLLERVPAWAAAPLISRPS